MHSYDPDSRPIEITTQKLRGKTVLHPNTSLTWQNCDTLKTVFEELLVQGVRKIVLDLSTVSYLDSKALELLVSMQDQLAELHGDLVIVEMNDICRDIFVATRLVSQFQITVKKDLALE